MQHTCTLHLFSDLLNEVDGWLEVESKVDELPLDVLLAVLLLLQHKHVVVEELLQLLIGEVDAELLKRVHHENLKTSNVQHSNEEVLASLHKRIVINFYKVSKNW